MSHWLFDRHVRKDATDRDPPIDVHLRREGSRVEAWVKTFASSR
jgi:hypothetical protein